MMDTRERLEADISAFMESRFLGKNLRDKVSEWLDRQDAITQRDCIDRWDAKLQATVDKLKQELAERNGAVCERDGRINAYERRNTELKDALKAICERYGVDAKWSPMWSSDDMVRKVSEGIEQTHMRLPVDADGVAWHIGDKVQRRGNKERPNIVTGLQFYNDGNHKLHVQEDDCVAWTPFASECRHVKLDTVESLLADFQQDTLTSQGEYAGEVIDADEWERDLGGLVEEYAERIRRACNG